MSVVSKINQFQQERRLKKIFRAWAGCEWDELYGHCTKTFQSNYDELYLEKQLGTLTPYPPKTLSKIERTVHSYYLHRVTLPIRMSRKLGGDSWYQITFMMVKEISAYTPHAVGMWGINPHSFNYKRIEAPNT